ncbi:MAG: glycine C-acetyltransferase [Roseiarcus sp.]|uniref:glycine C-acetyltransferase n=1 Tax=Roseiarcus sp. TaxID=1969460 RepID=UPI003BAE50AE
MSDAFLRHIRATLDEIETAGLTKRERLLTGPQGGRIRVASENGSREALNLCANNYLGLANHPEVIAAAARAMEQFGFGMASVRFICGAQTLHRELELAIAKHLGKDDAIAFAACFDANGGVFEPLMGEEDAIISDSLNHASIIDGVRLSKARRFRFANSDMNELEDRLKEADAGGARFKLIATDGVFSMDGYVAKLKDICALADRYGALVLVDDCHATGHLGEKGRGTPALTGAGNRVDIVTGTFGKTLGGGMGGFVAAAQPIVDLLRQRARPYLFSNSLAPPIAAGALKALEIAIEADDRRSLLETHAKRFRAGIEKAGFKVLPGVTPIIPVMLGEARLAQDLSKALDERGVFVAGFFFPVVPKGAARIRTQMSAALTAGDVDFAVTAFADAGRALRII